MTNLLNKKAKTADGRIGIIYDVNETTIWLETEEDMYTIKHSDIVEIIKETKTLKQLIIEAFESNFSNIEEYNNTDESALMIEELRNNTDITINDLNISKLTRLDKENITGYDYREDKIATRLLEMYFEDEAINYILEDVFSTLAEGRNIDRKYKKWFM